MPLKIEIESVDGQFSKEINVKKYPQKVTGNYRVVNWTEHQNKWPLLTQCSFAKPANNGLDDLLVGIESIEMQIRFLPVNRTPSSRSLPNFYRHQAYIRQEVKADPQLLSCCSHLNRPACSQ